MLPPAFLRPFPMARCPPWCPQDERNAGQPPIHQKFIAILLPLLVLLAALAAGRIRSNVTEGVRSGRVNALVVFTITSAAHLANNR
jgi:hypothetical protein